jgi:hypothetical protein
VVPAAQVSALVREQHPALRGVERAQHPGRDDDPTGASARQGERLGRLVGQDHQLALDVGAHLPGEQAGDPDGADAARRGQHHRPGDQHQRRAGDVGDRPRDGIVGAQHRTGPVALGGDERQLPDGHAAQQAERADPTDGREQPRRHEHPHGDRGR